MRNNLSRLKSNRLLRDMCSETEFNLSQLIQPLFVCESLSEEDPLLYLPGNSRHTKESLLRQIDRDVEKGVKNFILFCIPGEKKEKDFSFEFAMSVIRNLRKRYLHDIFLWVDTCLCSYTKNGHCGLFKDEQYIDQDKSLKELSHAALSYAQSGACGIAPSDMMDGRTKRIREDLDSQGFESVPIMSYSTKFASHFYGPFREAADSSPTFGDRRQYQLDVRDRSQAILASNRCAMEGADFLMVKPGLTSLDLIRPIFERTGRKVGAYQVSGEYAGLNLLAKEGLIHFGSGLVESWQVYKRAGAQFIITYGARYAKELFNGIEF